VSVFAPLADGAEVVACFEAGGYFSSIRLWYVFPDGGPGDTDYFFLARGVQEVIGTLLMPYLASELTLFRTFATPWSAPGQVPFLYDAVSYSGGNTSGSHSANVGILTRTLSARAPRAILNWNFVPGIPKDEVDLNTYTMSIRGRIVDAYSELFDTLRGVGWTRVCVSQVSAGAPRSSAYALRADIIQFPVPTVVQIRRRLKPNHLIPV
jgi:hypothetical protein